jgi:hypothetical protein
MDHKRFVLLSAPFIIGLLLWSMQGSIAYAAQASPDQGLVIFHRADVMKGKAIRFNLEQDGRPIGQLLVGTTLEVPLAPGTYSFTVRAPSLDGMDYRRQAARNLATCLSPEKRCNRRVCRPQTRSRRPCRLLLLPRLLVGRL